MLTSIALLLVLALPIATSVWFFLSLSQWLSSPMDSPKRSTHKIMMFVSGGITLFLIISLTAQVLFFMMALSHM